MMETLIGSASEFAKHLHHFVREGASGNDSILRTLELRRRDHLHGLGDLLRIFDRLKAATNVQKVRHTLFMIGGFKPLQVPPQRPEALRQVEQPGPLMQYRILPSKGP